jgi:transcriptional regulator with PAS, ATPase and Fis domain
MDKNRYQCDEVTPAQFQELEPPRPIRAPKSPSHEPHYEDFMGMTTVIASTSMRRLISMTARVGRTNSPVLITGESGTGKEIIARAVHQYSPRVAKPFIDVNCAALPEHLMESEIFGYEKGAFSGAESLKPGLYEAASGGTLFLDEIAELDRHMQAKLLRVLDGHSYFRLGGSRKVTADVRIVAATNLNLDDAVQEGKFRSDLFHRLDAFHLRVPPLRERLEDIAPLAEWFLRDTGLTIGSDALAILENYSWPGNVRELRNALSKAALFASGTEIVPGDLPMEIILGQAESPEEEYSLDGLEQQTICRVLAQTGGHQQKAADLLGISRRTLIRKLKLYRSPEHHAGKKIVA